ncbi:MAG TPA: hypothetical protein VFA12_18280 [Stellaceae bacterium]|nr:hypothetical protein [Stellaceae bacterium]
MGATAGLEVRLALAGALRLARGDRTGLACFDASADGFWRSFRAAVLGYPLYLVLLLMRVGEAEWDRAGAVRIVTVETIDYVINWTAFALAMVSMARWLGCERRYFAFMTAYNWCQLPEMALFALLALEMQSGLLPPRVSQFVQLAAAVAVLVYEWYIARVALETTPPGAASVVLLNLVLGLLVSQVAEFLY